MFMSHARRNGGVEANEVERLAADPAARRR
jgi:hypothetical protein